MKCMNPKLRKWVYLYHFDLLTEEQKITVESHLMECQACFQELYHTSPILEIMEDMPEAFIGALQTRGSIISRVKKYFKKSLEAFLRSADRIRFEPTGSWESALRFIVPGALIILIAVFITSRPPAQFSDLAIIEKAPYLALRLQGPGEMTSEKLNFDQAMSYYEQNDYNLAIEKLNAFIKQKSFDANGHFYLGICLLLTEKTERAINSFVMASVLSQQQNNPYLLERCYWYLGNAYLKNNEMKKALETFQKIIELGLDLTAEAQHQVTKINDRVQKKTNDQ